MEHIYPILTKYLTQSISAEEREELLQWKNSSSENAELFSEMSKLRLLKEFEERSSVQEIALALSKFQRKTVRIRIINTLKYAAAIAIIVSLSIVGWTRISAEKYDTIKVAEHETVKKVNLEDGTVIWLSAASELKIPKSFSVNRRNVSLKGKAFFDVKKNSDSPFLVTSPYLKVKVIGTSFDLYVNEQERLVETILVSGKVTLQDNHNRDIFTMSPGEKVAYSSDTNEYNVETVDANTLTAWHLDQMTFENATLREIVNKLSLIYDININLESKKLADRRYRYVINREETLEEVLDILSYLAPIHYRIEENEVFITE